MRKYFMIAIALNLLLIAGCGNSTHGNGETAESVSAESQISATAPSPSLRLEPSQPRESDANTPVPSTSSQSSESAAEGLNSDPPVTQTIPEINASVFYDENEKGSNLSVLCTGVGRYGLSYENSKSLLAYLDFARLTPTNQAETMGIDSADPGIVFTAPDFSYELRLDQNTGIAVYEIGGNTRYYYTMPEGFYSTAYEWVSTYAQYDYNSYPLGDEEPLNVTTGHNPDSGLEQS